MHVLPVEGCKLARAKPSKEAAVEPAFGGINPYGCGGTRIRRRDGIRPPARERPLGELGDFRVDG